MKRAFLFSVLAALVAVPAAAQSGQAASSGQSERPSIGFYGMFDYTSIASPKSFDAVFGSHTTTAPGLGVDAINIWKHFFVRIDGSRSTLSGERVVIFNDEVFKLGIPLEAELTPIEFGGGWRFSSKNPQVRFAPYVGVSAITLKYKETSSFAESGENVDEVYNGVGVFGGVDVRVASKIFAGAEAQYRSINSKPGPDSAAASFNEKNLGGMVLRVRVGVRF